MEIIRSVDKWRDIFRSLYGNSKTVGFVPTMGALHSGHQSLIVRSVLENDMTGVSIFVNPTQFNNPHDLSSYPVSWEEDAERLAAAGVDYLLLSPAYEDLYPEGYRYKIIETAESLDLCGISRPGHFEGVLTVVMKLLSITRASKAYFGEKDWQQYSLIKGMARAFFLDTEIIPCPIIREESGLALSSRNRLLTVENRKKAPLFYKTLSSGKPVEEMKRILEKAEFVIDYLKIREGRILAAVFLGDVRLIDNVIL